MKKNNLFLLIAALFSFITTTLAQIQPNVPTNGLIGWYPFNGNANDESGNLNNGSINGAILTVDRFGNENKAFYFDGVNDYIETLNPINLTGNSPRTVSVWFKVNVFKSGWSTLLNFGEPCPNINTSNTLQVDSSSNPRKLTRLIFKGNGPSDHAFNTPLTHNFWYHYVWTYDGVNSEIYLNSIKYTSKPLSLSTPLSTLKVGFDYTSLQCASLHHAFNKPFNGSIDDIGIWDRVLTQQEITNLYNGNICYQTLSVTDTLIINMGTSGFNQVNYFNTIKIFPNPTSNHITIDYGNFESLSGYELTIKNSLGQQLFQTPISQQSSYISLASWTGNGIYFVHIIDPSGNIIDIKKIVLQ
jgi:hypothetical protein